MKVGELIHKLCKIAPNTSIDVEDYDGNFIYSITDVFIDKDVNRCKIIIDENLADREEREKDEWSYLMSRADK